MLLIALIAAMVAVAWFRPCWLSDENQFLRGFVNQELLAVLGVVVTITLASAANLHLELNRLEDEYEERFPEARWANRSYAYLLIWLFILAIFLVVCKPIFASSPFEQALFNGAAIMIVLVNVLSLMDLTGAIFQIPSKRRIG